MNDRKARAGLLTVLALLAAAARAHAEDGSASAVLARSVDLLKRSVRARLKLSAPMPPLAGPEHETLWSQDRLLVRRGDRAIPFAATTAEGVPELVNAPLSLSLRIDEVTRWAVAGELTHWKGSEPAASADFVIVAEHSAGLDPFAAFLLAHTGLRVRFSGRELPLEGGFSLWEQVPFWADMPTRRAYHAILRQGDREVAALVVDNTDRPGTILEVTPLRHSDRDAFEAEVWKDFPFRCSYPRSAGCSRSP